MIALEHVQEGDWAALNRVIDTLRSLVLDTGGVSAGKRFGQQSVTVTASTVSGTVTVAHGLGRVPGSVQLTLQGAAGFGAAQGVNLVAAPTSTQIQFQVDFSVATTGTFVVFWEVLG